MTVSNELTNLIEASKILTTVRVATCKEPLPIWIKISHATDYINNQIAAMMSE